MSAQIEKPKPEYIELYVGVNSRKKGAMEGRTIVRMAPQDYLRKERYEFFLKKIEEEISSAALYGGIIGVAVSPIDPLYMAVGALCGAICGATLAGARRVLICYCEDRYLTVLFPDAELHVPEDNH